MRQAKAESEEQHVKGIKTTNKKIFQNTSEEMIKAWKEHQGR